MNVVVLLTGTVNPKGMSMTAIQDVNVRSSQYIDALEFWTKIEGVKIVFVENSGHDFGGDLQKYIDSGNFEYITYDGNNYDRTLGKGVGELECIDKAVALSQYVLQSDFIFKVTGRYKVLNFDKFLTFINENKSLDIMIDIKLFLTFSDSRFFGFKKEFAREYLNKKGHLLNDYKEVYFENILTKAALLAVADGYQYRPMPFLPRIKGYSGSLGKEFNSNYIHWLKHRMKYFIKYKSFGLGHMPDF